MNGRITEQLVAVTIFSFASVGMTVANKLAISSLPLPMVLLAVQSFASLALLLGIPGIRKDVHRLELAKVRLWLPVVALFFLKLASSLKCLHLLTVSTVTIFSNVTNLASSVSEYYFLGSRVNTRIVLSLLCILGGAALYGYANVTINPLGVFWIGINIFTGAAYTIYVKFVTDTIKLDLSKFGMSYYNNVLQLPALFVFAAALGEFDSLLATTQGITKTGWCWIGLSCVVGFLISTAGFHLQRLVTATTFNVINNLSKIAVIFYGLVFLGDRIPSWNCALGCVVALASGFWYSYERLLQRQPEPQEPVPQEP
eukprot:TRINITY_DN4534_c0_g2_i1.p1 TRINITY_DN4534_c0_g2~~TRINITY_DN4534_c0_g2_i1.p1  ORF type:complete len:313 (-),score=65.72 TRINITY_DN4534_c0_g2_i1:55-993(-)